MPPDGTLDRVAALAARLLGAAAAVVTLADRAWWTTTNGLRDVDPHTLADPESAAALGLRFHAGVPLTTSDGTQVGALCVVGHEPRDVAETDLAVLRDLAALAVDAVETRRDARAKVREAEALAAALQASLLPPGPPRLPGMELATRYEAAGGLVVGGDFTTCSASRRTTGPSPSATSAATAPAPPR